MVAHSGIAKSTTRAEMPAFFAERTVTGMVAAEDWVPIAVKYAGIMVLSIWMGLRRDTAPATEYCRARVTQCRIITMTNTRPKTERIFAT